MKNIDNEKRVKIFKILIGIVITLTLIYSVINLFPLIIKLSNETTREIAKKEISDMGVKGIFLMVFLQILQIIIAVIPGQPMEIISGMLYGTWGGMFVCLIGIFIGTTVIFYIVRKAGIKFIEVFFKEEKINEIRNSNIYKNPQKFEFLMLMIFSIPMIPKDIFIYIGGISPVRSKRFLTIATLGRIPGLFLTVYAGNRITEGNLKVVAIITILIISIGTIGNFLLNKFEERA